MKKIGLIALMAVLVLGLLGVGYAWTAQSAYVNDSVVTGQTAGGFYYGSQGRNFNVTDSLGIVHPVTAYITNYLGTYDLLALSIGNEYPGCVITNANLFAVWNYGTIPCTAANATLVSWDPNFTVITFVPPTGSIMPGTGNPAWGTGSITMTSNNTSINPNSTYSFQVTVNFTAP